MMVALVLAAALGATSPPGLAHELRARDQALLDAFVPGDRAVSEKALWSDAAYVDENGAIMNRAQFLASLNPLPKGASGQLAIHGAFAAIGDKKGQA